MVKILFLKKRSNPMFYDYFHSYGPNCHESLFFSSFVSQNKVVGKGLKQSSKLDKSKYIIIHGSIAVIPFFNQDFGSNGTDAK